MIKIFHRLLWTFIIAFAMVTCADTSGETEALQAAQIDSTKAYGIEPHVFPSLTTTAQSQVAQWSVFGDFEADAKALNGKTIEELRDRTERLITFTDSLSKKIPDSLYTNPIFSRLIVVKTRVGMLHQEVHRNPPDSVGIESSIKEMNIAVSNMIIQINEKFQKDAIDIQRKEDEEKELEKQRRFLDSVREAELEDQNRSGL